MQAYFPVQSDIGKVANQKGSVPCGLSPSRVRSCGQVFSYTSFLHLLFILQGWQKLHCSEGDSSSAWARGSRACPSRWNVLGSLGEKNRGNPSSSFGPPKSMQGDEDVRIQIRDSNFSKFTTLSGDRLSPKWFGRKLFCKCFPLSAGITALLYKILPCCVSSSLRRGMKGVTWGC